MRKHEIVVTTPKHSTIYAIGTKSTTSGKVWADVPTHTSFYGEGHYTPGYVLKIDSAYATVLLANNFPGSLSATHNKQASELDATQYTLEDYEARKKVLVRYSHWDGNLEEGRKERDETLAKLKQIPTNWRITVLRTVDIRMLWADYAVQLEAVIAKRTEERDAKQAERDAQKAQKMGIIERLIALGLVEQAEVQYLTGTHYGPAIPVDSKVLEILLDGAARAIFDGWEPPRLFPETKEAKS